MTAIYTAEAVMRSSILIEQKVPPILQPTSFVELSELLQNGEYRHILISMPNSLSDSEDTVNGLQNSELTKYVESLEKKPDVCIVPHIVSSGLVCDYICEEIVNHLPRCVDINQTLFFQMLSKATHLQSLFFYNAFRGGIQAENSFENMLKSLAHLNAFHIYDSSLSIQEYAMIVKTVVSCRPSIKILSVLGGEGDYDFKQDEREEEDIREISTQLQNASHLECLRMDIPYESHFNQMPILQALYGHPSMREIGLFNSKLVDAELYVLLHLIIDYNFQLTRFHLTLSEQQLLQISWAFKYRLSYITQQIKLTIPSFSNSIVEYNDLIKIILGYVGNVIFINNETISEKSHPIDDEKQMTTATMLSSLGYSSSSSSSSCAVLPSLFFSSSLSSSSNHQRKRIREEETKEKKKELAIMTEEDNKRPRKEKDTSSTAGSPVTTISNITESATTAVQNGGSMMAGIGRLLSSDAVPVSSSSRSMVLSSSSSSLTSLISHSTTLSSSSSSSSLSSIVLRR